MILIAFAARAGGGKTTAAELLVKHCDFTRVSFAAPLYDMLEAGGFGRPKTLEDKQRNVPALAAHGMDVTWRHAAQTLGTEWGRACIGPNVWTALALSKCSDPDGRYVIDDCRFENEAQAVREIGGIVCHLVNRAGEIGVSVNHESERGIAKHPEDFVLDNSGSMAALEEGLKDMLYAVVMG